MSTTKLTREELYEMVWTTPMMRLAGQFGISDVALAKTCRRLNIPRPGRGYWARLAAGEKLKRAPLPKAKANDEQHAYLRRTENRALQPRPRAPIAPPVEIPTTLTGAHDVVTRLGRLLQTADADEFDRLIVSDRGAPVLAVTVALHRRALLIVDALCKALCAREHEVRLVRPPPTEAGTKKACFFAIVRGCELEVSLVEILDQRERARTALEEDRAAFRSTVLRKEIPLPRESYASGRLRLSVSGLQSWRSSWSDGKTPIERHLGSVIVAMEGEADRRRAERERQEQARIAEEERRRVQQIEAEKRRVEQEAERKRTEEAKARREYRAALEEDLARMAKRWTHAREIRGFLDALEEEVPVSDRGEEFTEWLRWASEHASQLDPLRAPYRIAKTLNPDLDQLRATASE
jgi:hypothetical protein